MDSQSKFRPLAAALEASESWERETIKVHYMLKYIADKIQTQDDEACHCYQFRLTDHGRTRYGIPNKDGLCSTPRYKYQGEEVEAMFRIVDVKLFTFRTSVGILAYRVSFENDDPFWISNALFRMKKVSRKQLTLGSQDRKITLLDLSSELMGEFADITDCDFFFYAYEETERANVLTFLMSDSKDDFSKELFYLKRCYSEGYQYYKDEKRDNEENHVLSKGINWGVSPEAAVCIACPDAGIDGFINNTFFSNFNSQYLLMYVLLLHQKYVLYMYLTIIGNSDLSDLETLENYKNRLYEFETDFVFSCITEVPQYQVLYDKIARAFALRRMYEDVHEPITSLAEVRHEAAEKEQLERDESINSALILLSGLTIFSALIDSFDFFESALAKFFGASSSAVATVQAIVVILIIGIAMYVLGKLISARSKLKKKK